MEPVSSKPSYKAHLDALRVSERINSTVVERQFDGKSLCITHRGDGSCTLLVAICKNPIDRSEGYFWIDCVFDAEGQLDSSSTTFHREVRRGEWENTEAEFDIDWEQELKAFVEEQARQRSPEVIAQLEGTIRYILDGIRRRTRGEGAAF